MKEQTSSTSCFSHPIKYINTHVIQYLIVGEHNKLLFFFFFLESLSDSAGFTHQLWAKMSDRERAESLRKTKEKRKVWVWIDLKHHHNLPGVGWGPSVAHWSFHWQEPSQVPSKIYLSVLWCWHNVFLMLEIRLPMDEKKKKKPAFFPSPPAFFLLWCQSMKQTTRQAKISLKPSYLFKEVWILQWGGQATLKQTSQGFH